MSLLRIDWRLYEPFRRLVDVEVDGVRYHLPEGNPLLRGFQFLDPGCLQRLNFCWNGDCRTCEVRLLPPAEAGTASDAPARAALACQTLAGPGMRLAAPPRGVRLPTLDRVQRYEDLQHPL